MTEENPSGKLPLMMLVKALLSDARLWAYTATSMLVIGGLMTIYYRQSEILGRIMRAQYVLDSRTERFAKIDSDIVELREHVNGMEKLRNEISDLKRVIAEKR